VIRAGIIRRGGVAVAQRAGEGRETIGERKEDVRGCLKKVIKRTD